MSFQVARHKAPGIQIQKPIKLHVGAIPSSVAGRTDHLPLTVASGSYVLPADVTSHWGEGNTAAGFKHMRMLFGGNPYGGNSGPYGVTGGPYGAKLRAKGGEASENKGVVPVVVAGGEVVLSPEQVLRVGQGDMDRGHKVLDEFVKRSRAQLITTLKKLPGPAK